MGNEENNSGDKGDGTQLGTDSRLDKLFDYAFKVAGLLVIPIFIWAWTLQKDINSLQRDMSHTSESVSEMKVTMKKNSEKIQTIEVTTGRMEEKIDGAQRTLSEIKESIRRDR